MSHEADPEAMPRRAHWSFRMWKFGGLTACFLCGFSCLFSEITFFSLLPICGFYIFHSLAERGERRELTTIAISTLVIGLIYLVHTIIYVAELLVNHRANTLFQQKIVFSVTLFGCPAMLFCVSAWLAFTGNAEYKIWRHTCRRNRLNRQNPPRTDAPNPVRANARGQFPVDPSDGRPAT